MCGIVIKNGVYHYLKKTFDFGQEIKELTMSFIVVISSFILYKNVSYLMATITLMFYQSSSKATPYAKS